MKLINDSNYPFMPSQLLETAVLFCHHHQKSKTCDQAKDTKTVLKFPLVSYFNLTLSVFAGINRVTQQTMHLSFTFYLHLELCSVYCQNVFMANTKYVLTLKFTYVGIYAYTQFYLSLNSQPLSVKNLIGPYIRNNQIYVIDIGFYVG